MYGRFDGPKKVAVITSWPYYRGGPNSAVNSPEKSGRRPILNRFSRSSGFQIRV